MCQFNFIIVQHSGAAADYLESLGYYCFRSLQHGYDAYSWGRACFCNCGSMVGSYYLPKETKKYPNQLTAEDYRRCIQKEVDLLESAIKLQYTKGADKQIKQFEERYKKYAHRLSELMKERLPKYEKYIIYDHSELEDAPPGQEEIALQKMMDELLEDKVLSLAIRSSNSLLERLSEIKSSNYNMHEYRYYHRIFSRLLKLEPCIYFTHVWSEPGELNLVNTLTLDQLRIGDLALLAQDDVIKICQKDTGVL